MIEKREKIKISKNHAANIRDRDATAWNSELNL